MRKIGRNDPCPCGSIKKDGSNKKYKKCCLLKDEKKARIKQRIEDFKKGKIKDILISKPFFDCPRCKKRKTFGVFSPISGSKSYSRKCVECAYSENFDLPKLNKKIIYLDQFIISNLVKLLDPSHKGREEIKKNAFWTDLFIKLEQVLNNQIAIFPDSFIHRDESMFGNIGYKKLERLYEHFSDGNTFHPHYDVKNLQIEESFKQWLGNNDNNNTFNPQDICTTDLNTWSIGMRVAISMAPKKYELKSQKKENEYIANKMKDLWKYWSKQEKFIFSKVVETEARSYYPALIQKVREYYNNIHNFNRKVSLGQKIDNNDVNILFKPEELKLLNTLNNICKTKGLSQKESSIKVNEYFMNIDNLLSCPYIKISSVMFANLAKRAFDGQKKPPKNLNDINFIASYMPYCDAMFIDKESKQIIEKLPKNSPKNLYINNYNTKIFSLENKKEFLNYLDNLIESVPGDIKQALNDLGKNPAELYWDMIIEEDINLDDIRL